MSTYDFEPNPDDYRPEPDHVANPSQYQAQPMPQGVAQDLAYRLCSRYQHGVGVYEFDADTLLDLVRAVERHHKLIPQQNYVKLP